jgi:glutathione S-transferase
VSLLKKLHKIQTLTLSSEVAAENFDPEYLKINPNGTLPSLVVPSLPQPIIDSHLILQYLDQSRTGSESPSLTPPDLANKATMDAIVDLVRSSDAAANLILLRARDEEEYNEKRAGPFAAYIALRQRTLEKYNSAFPNHIFYGPKAKENSVLHRIYTTGPGHERDAFFSSTQTAYRKFAKVMDRLESLLVLPYAAGESVTYADITTAPWLAHALVGVGTKEITDLSKLESHIQKTVEDFKIGPKTQKWWNNYTERESFKTVFPALR